MVRTALGGKVVLGQFVVVTPRHWTEEQCQVELKEPRGQTRYKVSPDCLLAIDIVVHSFLSPGDIKIFCRNLISFYSIKHH